jgi:hypothetical protein
MHLFDAEAGARSPFQKKRYLRDLFWLRAHVNSLFKKIVKLKSICTC